MTRAWVGCVFAVGVLLVGCGQESQEEIQDEIPDHDGSANEDVEVKDENGNGLGRFRGAAVAVWCDESRAMKLVRDFVYVDPNGREWAAPKGTVIDGASIPRVLWAVEGSPYSGKYRRASIVHDAACYARDRPYKEVHKMFYWACRAGGVPNSKALKLWFAVKSWGPDWEVGDGPKPQPACAHMDEGMSASAMAEGMRSSRLAASDDPSRDRERRRIYEKMSRYVDENNPTLDELDNYRP